MIPKSQHNDPFAGQEFRPRSIANLSDTIVMPATVQFDRELCGRTIEIQDVAVQRMLPAKFVTCKISVPQMAPKNALRVGCLFSQQTSAIHEKLSYSPAQFRKVDQPPLTSILSPQAGRGAVPYASFGLESRRWRQFQR